MTVGLFSMISPNLLIMSMIHSSLALLQHSCSTSTPINHIVFFFCRIPVVLENRRSSQGAGVRTPYTLPLDPPLYHHHHHHFSHCHYLHRLVIYFLSACRCKHVNEKVQLILRTPNCVTWACRRELRLIQVNNL